MTPKQSKEKLVSQLLQTLDPKLIADESERQTIELLLNLSEELNSKVKELEAENQRLKDENNRLKGEQGKPDIKAKKPRGLSKNYSSEKERKTPKKRSKGDKTLVISLYYGGNMTQGKLLEFLEDIGISISAGHLSNLLIKNNSDLAREKSEVDRSGLASSPWQHFDQTGARVGGVNYTTNVVCNPLSPIYLTTTKKDRISVIQGLQNCQELEFILNQHSYELLKTFRIPTKWQNSLQLLPQETVFNSVQLDGLLEQYLPQLGSQHRTRILEAAASAFYHQQTDWPVVGTLVCDDAPQFKLLTDNLALCWVHEGRHYKKLNPLVSCHQKLVDNFLDDFWDYYRQLLAYRDSPKEEAAVQLKLEFGQLFGTESGYQQLDERKRLTAAKIEELLLVLKHPELPLHNNPAELAARTMVQRRSISYGTQTNQGTEAWDIFRSLVATTRKLGISFFKYVRERISETGTIPPLAAIIREKSSLNPFGWSWQPE